MGILKHNELHISDVLEFTSEDLFDVKQSISIAKNTLNTFKKENYLINGEFNDDLWIFLVNNKTNYTRNVNFGDVMNPHIKNILKCWTVEQLTKVKLESFLPILMHMKKVILFTNYFKKEKIEVINHFIEESVVESYQRDILSKTINFLDYAMLEYSEEYINEMSLMLKKAKSNKKNSVRELPPYIDVLRFHYILEDFMKNCSDREKTCYYPIYLWWKITSVIPMRISGFCSISRSCLSFEKGKFYITIPRSKLKKTERQIEILDEIEIDKNTYLLIESYINFTESFGKTETLISYRAYKEFVGDENMNHSLEHFNRKNFSKLLDMFYENVIFEKYHEVDIEKIKPNDTRHFAFCSLMLQGFNALTIARLGGHRSIESQNHYQQHLDYFIQLKVYELSRIYKLNQMEYFKDLTTPIELKELEINSLRNKSSFTYLEKMDIGYCTDKNMECESEYCQLCSKFWISKEKLKENYNEILNFKNSYEKRIKERIETMNRLRNDMEYNYEENHYSPNDQEALFREAKLLESEMNSLARLEIQLDDE